MVEYSDLLGRMVYNQIILPYQKSVAAQPYEKPIKIREKPKKKCLRETCKVMTDHNGGYCSANCCKEDRNVEKSHQKSKNICDTLS